MNTSIFLKDVGLSPSGFQPWTDPYYSLGLGSKVLVGAFILFFMAFGTIFHAGLICYERNSGDPQKRGVMNQLLSHFSGHTIVNYWATLPVVCWRIFIGPVHNTVFWYWGIVICSFFFRAAITIVNLAVHQYCSVVIYGRVLPILDDFVSMFLFLATSLLAFWFSYINNCTNFMFFGQARFTGIPTYLQQVGPLQFNFMLQTCIALFVGLCYFGVKYRATKQEMDEIDTVSVASSRLLRTNSVVHNESLFSTIGIGFASVLGICIALTAMFTIYSDPSDIQVFLFLIEDLGHPFGAMVVYPMFLLNVGSSSLKRFFVGDFLPAGISALFCNMNFRTFPV